MTPEHCLHCGMALNAYNAIACRSPIRASGYGFNHRCHGAWLDRRKKTWPFAALRDCSLVPPGLFPWVDLHFQGREEGSKGSVTFPPKAVAFSE